MINRINLILRAKNITARQFAEEIGIQPSGMSHILGGRNNPSLEFVSKVLRRYPEIDANWLLLGRGEMYSGGGIMKNEDMSRASEPTLFAIEESMAGGTPAIQEGVADGTPAVLEEGAGDPTAVNEPDLVAERPEQVPIRAERQPSPAVQEESANGTSAVQEKRRLVKILMFYDDHTFEEYRPQ